MDVRRSRRCWRRLKALGRRSTACRRWRSLRRPSPEAEADAFLRRNRTLAAKRSPLASRLIRFAFGWASGAIYLLLYLAASVLLLAAQYLAVERDWGWLTIWEPAIAGRKLPDVIAESFVLELTAIAGVLTLVAVAVGLLGNMLATSSEETFDAYFHEARPKGVVRCGVVLLGTLLVEYFWPLHGILGLVHDDTGILITRAAQIGLLLLWTGVVMFGAIHLLVTTIDFIRPEFRKKAIFRHAADTVIPNFLRTWYRQMHDSRRRWLGVAGLLRSEREDRPRVEPCEDELVPLDAARSRTPEAVLNALIADAVNHAARQDVAGFRERLGTATDFHRFLLLSFTDRGNPAESPLLKGFWGPLHQNWLRGYRPAYEVSTNQLALTFDFARAMAEVPTDVIGAASASPIPDEALSYLLQLHQMQLFLLAGWLRSRTAHPGRDGIDLLPRDRSAYERTVGAIIMDRGQFLDLIPARHQWPGDRPMPREEAAGQLPDLVDRLAAFGGRTGRLLRAFDRDLKQAGLEREWLRQALELEKEAATEGGGPTAFGPEANGAAHRGRTLLAHYRSAKEWAGYRASWDVLIDELSGELVLLGSAINERDSVSSPMLTDMLLKWPRRWDIRIRGEAWSMTLEQALDLTLVDCDWIEAQRRLARSFDIRRISGGSVFRRSLELAWQDALMVLTAVLLIWSVRPPQINDALSARTANALWHRRLHDPRYGHDGEHATSLRGRRFFEARMRLWLAVWRRNARWERWLDRFARIDGMTEAATIPNEVYQPTTISDVRDLDRSFLAMLVADRFSTGQSFGGDLEWLRIFMRRLFAQSHDHFLAVAAIRTAIADDVAQLEALVTTAAAGERPVEWFFRMMLVLLSDAAPSLGSEAERQVLSDLAADLQAVRRCLTEERRRFVDGLPIDPLAVAAFGRRLEALVRQSVGSWVYPLEPRSIAFGGAETGGVTVQVPVEAPALYGREFLTAPALDEPPDDRDLSRTMGHAVGGSIRQALRGERRDVRTIEGDDRSPAFWNTVAALAASVGHDPILLVPWGQATALASWVYGMDDDGRRSFEFSGSRGELGGEAMFRCGAVTVIRWEGPLILLSKHRIRTLRFLSGDTPGGFVGVAFRPLRPEAGDIEAALPPAMGATFDCCIELEWSDDPIFQLRPSAPEATAEVPVPTTPLSPGKGRKPPSKKPRAKARLPTDTHPASVQKTVDEH